MVSTWVGASFYLLIASHRDLNSFQYLVSSDETVMRVVFHTKEGGMCSAFESKRPVEECYPNKESWIRNGQLSER